MSTNVSIHEAQSNLRNIIATLAPDEEVVITDNQQPVAKLIGGPYRASRGNEASADAWLDRARGAARVGVTTVEVMSLTRGEQ